MRRFLKEIDGQLDDPRLFLAARLSGHLLIVIFCLLLPEIGESRFILAGVVLFGFLPGAIIVFLISGSSIYSPLDNYFDMICVCIGSYLSPDNWHLILMVALIVAQAPVLSVGANATRRFVTVFVIMLSGLSLTGFLQDVDQWPIAIGLIGMLAPAIIYMAHYQSKVSEEIRGRAIAHDSIRLVAGGVAHDFNNLLTSILVNAEFAVQTSRDKETLNSLNKVLEASDRAALLSKQLLSLSGRGVHQTKTLHLGDEIKGVAALIESTAAAETPIEIELNDPAPYVTGDPSQLQQVFINLLINAAEATTDGSPIQVDISGNEQSEVVITIKDCGTGISNEELPNIFEPFYTSKPKGHGLGLAAVARIVEEHNGSVIVQSLPDIGTEFTVSFPRTVLDELAEDQGATAPKPAELIVIADDDPALLALMARIARDQGYTVLTATDGAKFCELYDEVQDSIRLAVLDLKMPGRTGWECVSHIRTRDSRLPILIVSGFDPEEAGSHTSDPALRFLQKPFDINQFSSRLKEAQKIAE